MSIFAYLKITATECTVWRTIIRFITNKTTLMFELKQFKLVLIDFLSKWAPFRQPALSTSWLTQNCRAACAEYNSLQISRQIVDFSDECKVTLIIECTLVLMQVRIIGFIASTCACEKTVVMWKHPGHLTSMKKLFGACMSLFSLCLRLSSLCDGKSRSVYVRREGC